MLNTIITFIRRRILYILILLSIILITILSYRYHIRFLKFLILPTPIVPRFLLYPLARITQNDLLLNILVLEEITRDHFSNLNLVPVIIVLGDLPDLSQRYNLIHNTFFSSYITEKVLLLKIHREHKSVLKLIKYFWHGKCLHGMVLNFSFKGLLQKTYDINSIVSKIDLINLHSNAKVDVFFTINMNPDPSYTSNINWITLPGVTLASSNNSEIFKSLNNLSLKINQIYLSQRNKVINYEELFHLEKNKKTITQNISLLGSSSLSIQHIYLNKQTQNTNVLFLRMIHGPLYEACSFAKYINNNESNRKNKLLKILAFLLTCLMGGGIFQRYSHMIKFYKGVQYSAISIKKNPSKKISSHLSALSSYKVLQTTAFIYGKDFVKINRIKDKSVNDLDDTFKLKNKLNTHENIKFYNPSSNIIFDELNISLSEWIENYQETYENLSDSKKPNLKLKLYTKNTKKAILSLFDQWISTFQYQFQPYEVVKMLSKKIEIIKRKNTSINEYEDFIQYVRKLKKSLSLNYHQWWLNKDLGKNYKKLMNKIKNIPDIGDDLYVNMEQKCTDLCNNMNQNFLQISDDALGKFLTYDGKKIDISLELENLVQKLQSMLNNHILQLPVRRIIYPMLNQRSHCLIFSKNVLDKVLTLPDEYEIFLNLVNVLPRSISGGIIEIANQRLCNYITGEIYNSVKKVKMDYSLEEKAKNILNTIENLTKINRFVNINLGGRKIPGLEEIISSNISHIRLHIENLLNKSIFTYYDRISHWNNKNNIITKLFGKEPIAMGAILNNNINELKNINSLVARPMLSHIAQYSPQDYNFMKYFSDTLTSYTEDKHNDLSEFRNFLMNLREWKVSYAKVSSNHCSTDRFFAFHNQEFLINLQLQTNKILLKSSISKFNKMRKIFQIKCAPYTPFNLQGSALPTNNLIAFIEYFNGIHDDLIRDKNFMKYKKDINDILGKLHRFCSQFSIINNAVKLDIDIEVIDHEVQENMLTNLIINYSHTLGSVKYQATDHLQAQYDCSNGYALQINIVNTSGVEVCESSKYLSDAHTVLWSFDHKYGFFEFVRKHSIGRDKDDNTIIRLEIPLLHTESGKSGGKIVTFLKIRNFTEIPRSINAV